MHKRFILLALALGLCLCLSPAVMAANIIFVTETGDTDANGAQDDLGFEDFLKGLGHQVDVRRGNWTTLDAGKIAELNAADLVVVSRRTGSGNYATDATEIGQWNGLTSPMLLLTPYLSRGTTSSFRWYWVNSSTINNLVASRVEAVVPSHAIFKGVTLDGSNQFDPLDGTTGTGQTSFAGTLTGGSGYDAGYSGKALNFNGSSTYVALPLGPLMPTLSNATVAAYFSGMLDEFRIYNRVLSAAEVRYLAGDR